MSGRRDTALRLAKLGYKVFPSAITFGSDGKKTTKPYVKWITTKAATSSEPMISTWWDQWPNAYPCIDCGASGIVVVDCDVKHNEECNPGCPDGLARYSDQADSLTTASGGKHYIYRADPENPAGVDADGKIDRHVDVRGIGGMIIVHDNADIDLLPEPENLCPVPPTIPKKVPSKLTKPVDTSLSNMLDIPARSFTYQEAVDFCRPAIDALKAAAHGSINDRLNDAASQFSHFVPTFFSEEDVTKWLIDAQRKAWIDGGGEDNGDYSAALGTIRSGLGQQSDRWRAELVLEWKKDETFEQSTPQLTDLDREIQRERIRREARRLLNEEELAATASQESVDSLMGEILSSEQLDDIQELEPLIDGWLYKDSIARIVGESGSFKTFVALDMALSVSAGKSGWFGWDVAPGPVLYVAAEGARGIRSRVRAWEFEKNSGKRVKDFYIYPKPIQVLGTDWPAFIEICKKLGTAMVILDTQARVTVGVNENDNTDMGRVIDHAERLRRETGACVVLVHHTGYDKSHARGATSVYGALQTELSVSRDGNDVVLKAEKQKDSEELGPVNMKMVDAYDSLVLVNMDSSDEKDSAEEALKREIQVQITEAMSLKSQILEVLCSVSNNSDGITIAELKRHLNDFRIMAGLPKFISGREKKRGQTGILEAQMRKAITSLQSEKKLVQGSTKDRLMVSDEGYSYIGQAPPDDRGKNDSA